MHLQFLITYSMIVFLPTVSWTGTCRRPRNKARLACKTCYLLSLVPRPSASRARTAYVTFEPLSDSWQLSDKGSKVTYAVRARLADGLGIRLLPASSASMGWAQQSGQSHRWNKPEEE